MSALELQKQSEQWLKEKGRFVPNPSTWLNGERWEDSIESMNASEKKKAKRDYYSEPDFIDLLEESRRKEALNVAQ